MQRGMRHFLPTVSRLGHTPPLVVIGRRFCSGQASAALTLASPPGANAVGTSSLSLLPGDPAPIPVYRRSWGKRKSLLYTMLGVCVGVMAASAGVVVLCRPLDTPPYLIPYYVRDARSRFAHYASVRKRKGGPAYMTVDDFVLALLASPDKKLKNPAAADDLRELFNSIDVNGDGYISFPEFRFLMSLLTTHPDDMKALFKIVDTEKQGSVSLEEFSSVLRGLTQDESLSLSVLKSSNRRNGLLCTLFGSDDEHAKRCTYDQLAGVIHTIRREVWKAEFRQFDPDRTDSISAEDFSELIANQILGSHVPYHIVNNIRKLRGAEGGKVTLNMWISFHEIMQGDEDLVSTVEMYCASGLPLTRSRFQRALRAVGIPEMPETTLELVFAIFDKNNDGTMEFDEFISVMKQKIRYHYSTPVRDRKSLPRRFTECSAAAIESLKG